MTPVRFRITAVDRYLLRQMAPRMGIALLVTVLVLLLERLLRLIELVATEGAPLKLVLGMVLSLLPHYLGLALPATFCIATLTALAALSRDNELDALENSGWSLRRIGAPFIAAAVALSLISLPLFGELQPYTRYAFRAIKHAARNVAWSGRLEEGVFVDAGNGLVVSAGEVDPAGRLLSRVFVIQREEDGTESVFTSEHGLIVPDQEKRVVNLLLKNGRGLVAGGWLDFNDLKLRQDFEVDDNPFRDRGAGSNELTFGELLDRARGGGGLPADPGYLAEFNARIVRSVSVIGVALMSVPLGVTRKRAAVWPRIALALALMVAFNEVLQMMQSMAELGRIDPVLGPWSACAGFIVTGLWLYVATPGQGSASPLRGLLRGIDALTADLTDLSRRVFARWSGSP